MNDNNYNNNNNNNNNSSQTANPIIFCVIAILVLIIGILVGVLYINMKKGKKVDSANTASQVSANIVTEAESAVENTTVETTAAAVHTTASVTVAATAPPVTQPPPPSANAYIDEVKELQGKTWYLNVNGDYSYYYFEIYDALPPEWQYKLINSGNSSESRMYIEGASMPVIFKADIIPYNSAGVAGKKISLSYGTKSNGVNNSVPTVTPCNKYGTIKAGSVKIDGFTTAYVVNGAAASYERHDLTDGWHITAVNSCYSRGVQWYELYDSDDGDYYGWVDANFINFY